MGGVSKTIMDEFCHVEMFAPRERVCSADYTEVGFKFLIQMFSLSISLRMISSGERDLVSENSS